MANFLKYLGFETEIEKAVKKYKAQSETNTSKVNELSTEFSLVESSTGDVNKIEITKGYAIELLGLIRQREDIKGSFKKSITDLLCKGFKYQALMGESLGRKRTDMPQIEQRHLDSFLIHFSGNSKDAKVMKTTMKLSKLKPSQEDIDIDKVIDGLTNDNWKDRYYVVSQDNYIIDGNHSWASGLEMNPGEMVNVYKINLPASELIRRTKLLKITRLNEMDGEDNIVKSCFDSFVTKDSLQAYISKFDNVIDAVTYSKIRKGLPVQQSEVLNGNVNDIIFNKADLQANTVLVDGVSPFVTTFYTSKKKGYEVEGELCEIEGVEVGEGVVIKGFDNEIKASGKIYADAIIQDGEGNVLFLKRTASDTFGAWKYGLVGGSVEEGETIGEALRREVVEETGLVLGDVHFLITCVNPDGSTSHYFHATYPESPITLDGNEHDNYIWADSSEWDELEMIGQLKQRLDALFDGGNVITKSFANDDFEKAMSGVYTDNAVNKKLNRVGQKYGSKKQEAVKSEDSNTRTHNARENVANLTNYAKKASDKQLKDAVEGGKLKEHELDIANKELEHRGLVEKKEGNDKSENDIGSITKSLINHSEYGNGSLLHENGDVITVQFDDGIERVVFKSEKIQIL